MMQFRTKEEQVADFLREGIISGRIPRGVRLKQQEIATMLKTSITPVREALKLLAAEGYVLVDSYRGATVAPFDIETSTEVLNLRILLETQLVRGATERVTVADIAELKILASEFGTAFDQGENETARAANYRFHHRMFEIAQMPQTLHFVQILWARYPFDLINRLKGRVGRASDEHDELLAALIAGDAAAAMLATRQHIEAGFDELRASLNANVTDPERHA
ncbi:DNA-binding GntR family transcriptional regulator [Novosphingobium chloroacetimidivorans]|uniref:DNA-binding GntR family transcriptional regulator n=1 Tax=Novosphingobium chloroacetimidivorans TaxID=1428314 RepID=A0A7W7NVA8_9SPHN|nr:GntR family transcriptional regulator [Novosphingobium chloroacetimidivorans]MBB4858368.1 DNA-binding GntR family transcriptional regulator [Novosphingobium chloroacetimidivorans]